MPSHVLSPPVACSVARSAPDPTLVEADAGLAPTASAPESRARLAVVLREHFHAVWCAVRRLGVPEHSADDAAQEVFIVAARRLDEIRAGHERRFLYGVAVRVAANVRRAQATRRERLDTEALLDAVSDVPAADVLLEQKRLRQLLDWVLDRMTDELRAAFVLHELEGFSAPEIAEMCGVPVGTAASRLRRAREAFQAAAAQLKAAYGARGDEP